MRFTTTFCAIVSLLCGLAVPEVTAQAGNPAAVDSQVRDALRKALDAEAPPATAAPVAPAAVTKPAPESTPQVAPRVVLVPSSTNATTASLSLDEAIRLALVHNLSLQVQRYTPLIAEYDRRTLYGAYDPTFSSGVGWNETLREPGGINLNTGNTTPGTRSETRNAYAGLTGYLPSGMTYGLSHNVDRNYVATPQFVGTNSFGEAVYVKSSDTTYGSLAQFTATQPLLRDFWIDGTRLSIQLARRNVTISQLDLERMMMTVINTVEQAYYELIAQREVVRVREADVTVRKQFYDEQRRRVEVGTLAPLEEKLAQSEVAAAEIALLYARNDAVTAENNLKGLIRDDFLGQLNVRLSLTDSLLAVPATFDLQNAVQDSLQARPDLQAQRVNLEKLQIQLKYDYNQLFPRLDLTGTLGYNGLDQELSGALRDIRERTYDQNSVGLALSFPLTMHAERNARKSTKAAQAQAVVAVKQLEEAIIQEVEGQIRLLRTAWSAIPLTREQTAYAQAALEAEQKKLAAGKSTSFEVLSLARALTTAQVNEIATLRDYNRALSELAFRKGATLQRWRIDRPVPPSKK